MKTNAYLKRKSLASLLLIFTLIFSCKKKDTSASNETPAANTTGSAILGGDWGTFLSAYSTSKFLYGVYEDSLINVNFYDSPLSTHSRIYGGTVSVNNTTVMFNSNGNIYASSNNINIKTLKWQVSGSGTVAASSFSYVPSYPVYTGANLLPGDTVLKSNGLNIVLNGISNTTHPTYIYVGQSNSSATITRSISIIPSTITLNPTDLSVFASNYPISIRISMFNYSTLTLNNKQYGINANRDYTKECFLK